jgi:AMP nucleosidase
MTPEGVKTQHSDKKVTSEFAEMHLQLGIESMTELQMNGEKIKHFSY